LQRRVLHRVFWRIVRCFVCRLRHYCRQVLWCAAFRCKLNLCRLRCGDLCYGDWGHGQLCMHPLRRRILLNARRGLQPVSMSEVHRRDLLRRGWSVIKLIMRTMQCWQVLRLVWRVIRVDVYCLSRRNLLSGGGCFCKLNVFTVCSWKVFSSTGC